MTTGTVCECCGSTAPGRDHVVCEMMFGSREPFRYCECAACGRLRLVDVPSDLSRYYPESYYSLAPLTPPESQDLRRAIRGVRADVALRLPTRLIDSLVEAGRAPGIFAWTAGLRLHRSARIADVGSGSGHVLRLFARNGFSNLEGFDPYLTHESPGPGIRLVRAALEDITGSYDLVMLHHAFEHMPDPLGTMRAAAQLLAPRGALLIRTPVADCWAWRHYGVNWVQLDAPRHLYIHTTRSVELLANQSGLRLHRRYRDSTGFQIWGSELVTRGLPLRPTRLSEIFSSETLADFEQRAKTLNATDDGDSACFLYTRGR